MKKIILILVATLAIASCDLLYNQDSDSSAPLNDISISAIETTPFAKRGEIITVGITVTNSGTSIIDEEFEILLNNQTDGITIGNNTLSSGLAPKDSIKVSYSWNTGDVSLGPHVLVAKHTFKDDNADNDSLKSIVMVSEPDLNDIVVTSFEGPSEATQGDTIELTARVENQGNQDVNKALSISLVDQNNGSTVDSKTINEGLDAGETKSIIFNWDTEGAAPGNYKLEARHNLADDNSDNDSKSIEIQLNEAIFLDVAISTINAPDSIEKNDKAIIKVTISNLGNRDTKEEINVSLVDQTENKTISKETIKGGLKINNSKTLQFEWNTKRAKESIHTLKVSHDFSDDNVSNNSRTFEIMVIED